MLQVRVGGGLRSHYLQSISHPQVFAAGDVAAMVNHPRPKAGVFAVRQGKPLVHNLRCVLQGKPLKPFHPQKQFLILVGTGEATAIASKGPFTLGPASWIWRWKDYIDRQFMAQFTSQTLAQTLFDAVPAPPSPSSPSDPAEAEAGSEPQPGGRLGKANPLFSSAPILYCSGCASKLGSPILHRVLTRLQDDYPQSVQRPDVVIGLNQPDDGAAIAIAHPTTLVQTLDYFRALVDDPFVFGQIAANHCLSDLFAMGVMPHSVMAIATLPHGSSTKLEETLYLLLAGVLQILQDTGATLIGGHTVEGDDLALGLSCNGFAGDEPLWRKSGMGVGDAVILTKALGTGTLFAADMRLQAKGRWILGAIESMVQSNQDAALCLRHHGATACTDVTGFGLAGHLLEMVRSAGLAMELHLEQIPALDGALTTLAAGWHSSLHAENARARAEMEFRHDPHDIQSQPMVALLFDPQTSGGLLATVPGDRAIACVEDLHHRGYTQSGIIGRVVSLGTAQAPLVVCTGAWSSS